MEPTSERFEHLEELMTVLIDGFKRVEDKKVEYPVQENYMPVLEQIQKGVVLLHQQNENKNEQITRVVTGSNNLLGAIEQQKAQMETMIADIPARIKLKIQHQFSDRTRPYIIVFVIALLLTAISVSECIHLWRRNSELRGNDIKFRATRMRKPTWAATVDSAYCHNPDSVERTVKAEEEKSMAVNKAKLDAEQKLIDATNAKKELDSLENK